MNQNEKKKLFHNACWSEILFLSGKCIRNKEVVGTIIFVIGAALTALQISKMGIDLIPFFINGANVINIMIFLFLVLVIMLMLFTGVMFLYDIIYIFGCWIIKVKRYICKYLKWIDNSQIINSDKIAEIIISATLIIAVLVVAFMTQGSINNYPKISIKLSSDKELSHGQLVYNTGDGYIIYIDSDYIFIPNDNIEYINMGNPNERFPD